EPRPAGIDRRGPAVRRVAILRVLGDVAREEIKVERRGKELGCDESRRLADRDSRRERAKRCSPNARVDELARAQALVIGASPRQGAPVSKRADVGRARADVEKEALA